MSVVALVVHQHRPEAAEVARSTARWLEARGHIPRLPAEDAEHIGLPELGVSTDELTDGLDLALSLGGDGTMLRAVDLVAAHDVPVMGVNFGQLGYLTEIEPRDIEPSLERYFAGEHQIEHRMMLGVTVDAPSGALDHTEGAATASFTALNEAVLEKTPLGHTVRLDVTIDGLYFTPYATDGLIVSTATGSTAYSFSARGPIVEPTHRCMLLTPVSPHMLFDRVLVLEPTSTLRLEVASHRPAALSIDGRMRVELQEGDSVLCTAAPFSAQLVTFSPRDFHLILKAKFGLNDR